MNRLRVKDIKRFGHDPVSTFRRNMLAVEERVARACASVGRDPASVRVLPVSKTIPAHILHFAYAAGMRSFSESQIKHLNQKCGVLGEPIARWGIIGSLRLNQVRYIAPIVREFHGLDSLPLAVRLNARYEPEERFLDVYIRVNLTQNETAYGVNPASLLPFLERVIQFSGVKTRGLTTFAPFDIDKSNTRQHFRQLRQLRDESAKFYPELTGLSMGTTYDFEEAIKEGATVVRLGHAIFHKYPEFNDHCWPSATVHRPA